MGKKWKHYEHSVMFAYIGNQTTLGNTHIRHEDIVKRLDQAGYNRTIGAVAGELSRFTQALHSRVFFSDWENRKSYASWVNTYRVFASTYNIELYNKDGDITTSPIVCTEEIVIGKRGEKIHFGGGAGSKIGPGFHTFKSTISHPAIPAKMVRGVSTSHKKVKTMTLAQANWPDTLEMLRGVMTKKEMANSINNYLMFKLDREPMKVSTLVRYVSGGKGYENKSVEFVMEWGQKLRDIANGKVKK